MTAGRTNHTKFAAAPREEITFPAPTGDWGRVTHVNGLPLDYVLELREDRRQVQAWLTGDFELASSDNVCTLCGQAGHRAHACPRADALRPKK